MKNHSLFQDELSYRYYRGHQEFEISNQAIASKIDTITPACRYTIKNDIWYPIPYPGFALVAMTNESNNAQELSLELHALQKILISLLASPDRYVPLPVKSFHQTIANTFSTDRFNKHILSAGLVDSFPIMVNNALNEYPIELRSGPIHLKLRGLSLFKTAIVIIADIENENEYDHLLAIRDSLYNNKKLNNIGLKRTRPFIGHITLVYIEKDLDLIAKSKLKHTIYSMNKEILYKNLIFTISNVELRRYDHLSEFHTISTIPSFSLCN